MRRRGSGAAVDPSTVRCLEVRGIAELELYHSAAASERSLADNVGEKPMAKGRGDSSAASFDTRAPRRDREKMEQRR